MMRFGRYFSVAALSIGLALAAALLAARPALAQATNAVAINNTSWTSIGVGPLTVSALGPEWPGIGLIQSTGPNCTGVTGAVQQGEPLRDRRYFGEPFAVCAKSTAATANVLVTAPDLGASGGGAGSTPSNPSYATSLSSGATTNATSTLTRPANTTAYASGQAIESSTTAGSSVVPSYSIANVAGGAILPKWTLTTNATTGWGAVAVQIDLWRSAPTYTNGDGGAYLIATGSANYLGSLSCTFTQAGDGAYADCAPLVGTAIIPKLASGTAIYWTAQILAAATPISGQTFTLTAEALN